MTYNEIMNQWKTEAEQKRAAEIAESKARYDAWVAAGCPETETVVQKAVRHIGMGVMAAGINAWSLIHTGKLYNG